MHPKNRITGIEIKLKAGNTDKDFWDLVNTLPDDKETFTFLFNAFGEKHAPFFKICLAASKSDAVNAAGITDFVSKVTSSKHLTDKYKIGIVNYAKGYIVSSNAKEIQGSLLIAETFWVLTTRYSLPDEAFIKALKTDTLDLIKNRELTRKQHTKLFEYVVSSSKLNDFSIKAFQEHKPSYVKVSLEHDWLYLKTCFNFNVKSNAELLKSFLKDVDVDTFKALEVSWPGTFGDLIQACAFNGPDKPL